MRHPWLTAPNRAVMPPARTAPIELGGVTVHLRRGTRQVITVKHTDGWHARVAFWRKTHKDGWKRVAGVRDGRTGYGGLVPGPSASRAPALRRSAPTASPSRSAWPPSPAVPAPVPPGTRRRLLGAGQPVRLLQPAAQQGARAASAGGSTATTRPSGCRTTPASTAGRSSSTSTGPARCATAGRASSCTSTVTGPTAGASPRREPSSGRRCNGCGRGCTPRGHQPVTAAVSRRRTAPRAEPGPARTPPGRWRVGRDRGCPG